MRPIILLLLGTALVSSFTGCASTQKPNLKPAAALAVQRTHHQVDRPKDLHTARYTVVSTEPVPEQLRLTTQIVDIHIPAKMAATVKDGMTYLIARTGYTLCDGRTAADVEQLYRLPLPAIHYRIGPTPLIRALQVLAGSTYEVRVDEVNRVVCFALDHAYPKGEGK